MSASYALAVPDSRSRRPSLYGTRAQLAVDEGDVEGYLALAGCDKRAGTASYALRIVNQSRHPLRARMTCARLRGEPVLAYPLDVHVAPFSISETLLPVRTADVGPYDRAIVEVAGGDVTFSLEAPAPPNKKAGSRWIAGGAAAAAFTFACAFGAAFSTPRIELLAAPARALAGTQLDVPYAFGGWAAMQYALQTRDGRQIAAGLATAHEGSLHFSVPKRAGSDVVLSASVAGPFGRRALTRHIALTAAPLVRKAAPVPVSAAASISEFTMASPLAQAGHSIKFTYATNARAGEIWLIDDSGRVWARRPVFAEGITWMHVPDDAAGRQLRAVMHARSGATSAVASIGIFVMPGEVQSGGAGAPASAAQPPATLTLSTETAGPGDTITATLEGAHGDARITMSDKSGNAVAQGDVPASQNAVTLTAPEVTEPTTYYIVASITQGRGEETVVRKVLVSPR